jgi:thiosulfate/3-mercaptopyruvate sulfurtransferase
MRKTLPRVMLACTLVIPLLAACGNGSVTEPEPQPQLTTRSELLVSTEWLAARLNDPTVVVLHVGTQANYDAGHIPGARFVALAPLQPTTNEIPFMLADAQVLRNAFEAAGVGAQAHVIVTGDGLTQATRGFFMLEYLGHPRVALLDGGKQAWQADNRPLSTENVLPTRGTMGTSIQAGRLAVADWVNQNRQAAGVFLVDARAAADYAGDVAASTNLPRPGHIPGAWNVPWQELVVSTTVPRMKDVASLRAAYEPFGTDPRNVVVAYCFSGMLSSVNYFVARYLGYDARLYDGSMFEWSRRQELPVAKCATRDC